MNISVLGGGPAGLYFACSVKALNPSFRVSVYESQFQSINSRGLGYTLQSLGSQLLAKLDPQFMASLFPEKSPLLITEALFKTQALTQSTSFDTGYSVTRPALMNYLMGLSESLGIRFVDKKVTKPVLKKLQRSSDLVVGADGINSIVRNEFLGHFRGETYTGKLKYSWFINQSQQIRREACFYAFQAPEGVILLTSYPVTDNKQIVVIEMTEKTHRNGSFASCSPEDAIPYLNQVLSQNGDDIKLRSAGLPWYSFRMNSTKNLSYQNIALLGDAAYSFHYSAGQGLTTAFTMGYTLAQCLLKAPDIPSALQHYSQSVRLSLRQPEQQSLKHIKWFEAVDDYFDEMNEADQLGAFILKEALNTKNTPLSKVSA